MKRFTIILPEELHTRFKIACTLEGTEMSEVIRGFMEEYAERIKGRKLIPHRKEKK
jgi:metal-responsive CopG/Arc/MetJ family transcriptional regulator